MRDVRFRTALAVGLPLLLADCVSKRVAEAELLPHNPHPVLGDVVRFTLTYNTDAALGLSLGSWSRVGFTVLALCITGVLLGMLRKANPAERFRAGALGCLLAGAMGNLLDRLQSSRGVVDFIDVGIGPTRFYTFNLADLAVCTGAILLMVALNKRDDQALAEPSGRTPNPLPGRTDE